MSKISALCEQVLSEQALSEQALSGKAHFLGVHARTSEPFYPAWSGEELRNAACQAPLGHRDLRDGVTPTDPAEAGWGVVVAAGEGDAVLEALAPLLDLRREQAGRRFRKLEYRAGESVDGFRRRYKAGIGAVDPDRIPYYLLLVGSPDHLPWDLQFDLGVQHAVGRIDLDDAASYAEYAKSVVAHERTGVHQEPSIDFHSFDHEGDEATQQALCQLLNPLGEQLSQRFGIETRLVRGREATRERLRQSLAEGGRMVFTMGHSILYDANDSDLQSFQGSLLTGEWRRGETVLPRHVFWPEDVPQESDLSGRIVFLYGCHTAGTPENDTFELDSSRRKALAPRPFVAPLAKRLLGRPGGSVLAVIGQVDRAVPSKALGWGGVPQIDTFHDSLRSIFRGEPVGRALETFGRRFAEVAVRMVEAGFRGREPADLVPLWTAYQDARSICLLGDPLASLGAPPATLERTA